MLDDSPVKLLSLDESIETFEYHDREFYDVRINPETPIYLSVYFRSHPIKKIYTRSIGSLLEFLGDIGGMIELVLLFFAGIMSFIIGRSFRAAMISDTYKVQKYSRDLSEFYPSSKAWKNDGEHSLTTASESISTSSSDDSDKSVKYSGRIRRK